MQFNWFYNCVGLEGAKTEVAMSDSNEWLQCQTSIAEVEAQRLESEVQFLKAASRKKRVAKFRQDKKLKAAQEELERRHARWKVMWEPFIAQKTEGDEIWEYSTPREEWNQLMGHAGYALVRDGTIIDILTTRMN